MGCIGFELAKKWLGAMGDEVIAFDPYSKDSEECPTGRFRRVEELEGLLENADGMSLHIPLTPSTTNLISHRRFELMKEGATRGGTVPDGSDHIFPIIVVS